MIPDLQFTHQAMVIPPVALPSREIGSVLEFHGLVREQEQGQALTGLFYEAHETMARKRLAFHAEELQARHPVTAVWFIHRLGWVPVGEASLFIRVLSSHRAEGLLFLSELVVRLKQDVPIWKLVQPPG
jgi:molybdopterin synthase catalytic subunit